MMQFVQLVPEMLTNVMMTSRCHVMTSRYASRWRLYFFRNPWPLKRRIQNKPDVICASSPGDMCFNQPIHLSLVTTCALVFSLRREKVNINSGSSPVSMLYVFFGHSMQSATIEIQSLFVNQRRLCDSTDHSNSRPTSFLCHLFIRVEQTVFCHLSSIIYFIFQIQTQNSLVQNPLWLKLD